MARKPIVRAGSEHARQRIISITEEIVASRIKAGEVDPKNKRAFEKAVRRAVLDATAAYHAAEEFVGG